MPRKPQAKDRKKKLIHIQQATAKVHFGTRNVTTTVVIPAKKVIAALRRRHLIP